MFEILVWLKSSNLCIMHKHLFFHNISLVSRSTGFDCIPVLVWFCCFLGGGTLSQYIFFIAVIITQVVRKTVYVFVELEQ